VKLAKKTGFEREQKFNKEVVFDLEEFPSI
jgi:hypothetical protein